MGRIYERRVRSLSARVGDRTVWDIGFPPEAFIQKIIVKQVGGAPANFSLEVYNHALAARQGSLSSGGADPEGDYIADPELYKVFETQYGAAGELLRITDEYGRAFRNQDGTYTAPVRKIYLVITPAGGEADATWDVSIGGFTDVG